MGNSQNFTMKRVFSTRSLFGPLAWSCGKVVPIVDESNAAVGYLQVDDGHRERIIRELPNEFFNHELKNLDPSDPQQFAAFMSSYGLLGTDGNNASRTWLQNELMHVDPEDGQEVVRVISRLSGDARISYSWTYIEGTSRVDGEQLEKNARVFARGVLRASETFGGDSCIKNFVTDNEARSTYYNLLQCVKIQKALIQFNDVEEISSYAGFCGDDLYDQIQFYDDLVNNWIRGASPKQGIICEDAASSAVGRPSYTDFELDRGGCLEHAIALQIWEFGIRGSEHYNVCNECGEVFVAKRVKSRKTSSRSSSDFCCDKCKNRYGQRKYRKTPAYRLKQDRAKANTAHPGRVVIGSETNLSKGGENDD